MEKLNMTDVKNKSAKGAVVALSLVFTALAGVTNYYAFNAVSENPENPSNVLERASKQITDLAVNGNLPDKVTAVTLAVGTVPGIALAGLTR